MVRKSLALAIALAFVLPGVSRADTVSDLQAQVNALQKQIDALKAKLEQVTTEVQTDKAAQEKKNEQFLQRSGPGLTFGVPGGGDVSLYGNLDVSFDYATKGLNSDYGPDNGGMPVGKMGWQPDISTNLSYIGVRGRHPLQPDLAFVWQLEGGIEISATPGTK